MHGEAATVVLKVPGPGTIVLRNGDIDPIAHNVPQAGRVRLQVRLSRSGVFALRQHRHWLRLHLSVSFTPTQGKSSRTAMSLLFR